jgi:hypothetical protein
MISIEQATIVLGRIQRLSSSRAYVKTLIGIFLNIISEAVPAYRLLNNMGQWFPDSFDSGSDADEH